MFLQAWGAVKGATAGRSPGKIGPPTHEKEFTASSVSGVENDKSRICVSSPIRISAAFGPLHSAFKKGLNFFASSHFVFHTEGGVNASNISTIMLQTFMSELARTHGRFEALFVRHKPSLSASVKRAFDSRGGLR